MKFSLFFEMQIADPAPAKEALLFHQCLEQAVLADELGYHCISIRTFAGEVIPYFPDRQITSPCGVLAQGG